MASVAESAGRDTNCQKPCHGSGQDRKRTSYWHLFELLINLNKFEELQDLLSLHREVHSGWLLWQGVWKEI